MLISPGDPCPSEVVTYCKVLDPAQTDKSCKPAYAIHAAQARLTFSNVESLNPMPATVSVVKLNVNCTEHQIYPSSYERTLITSYVPTRFVGWVPVQESAVRANKYAACTHICKAFGFPEESVRLEDISTLAGVVYQNRFSDFRGLQIQDYIMDSFVNPMIDAFGKQQADTLTILKKMLKDFANEEPISAYAEDMCKAVGGPLSVSPNAKILGLLASLMSAVCCEDKRKIKSLEILLKREGIIVPTS